MSTPTRRLPRPGSAEGPTDDPGAADGPAGSHLADATPGVTPAVDPFTTGLMAAPGTVTTTPTVAVARGAGGDDGRLFAVAPTPGTLAARSGQVTSADCLDVPAGRWDALIDVVAEVTTAVQQQLTDADRGEEISTVRASGQTRDPELLMARDVLRGEVDGMATRWVTQHHPRLLGDPGELAWVVGSTTAEITGFGPLQPLLDDPAITEVMVNGPLSVWVERDGALIPAPGCRFRDDKHVQQIAALILAPLNRRVDARTPLTDGRLPDRSRVNVVDSSVAPDGMLMTIRKFPLAPWTISRLIDVGAMSEELACDLARLIIARCSTVVVGATGTGKTSMLNSLSGAIPRGERLVTIEDSAELQLHPDSHIARLEGRPASASGAGEVTIRDLVLNALRMRPDRIIVGEVRGETAYDMLQAMNTGHEGSMTTVHANDPQETISRLTDLASQARGVEYAQAQRLVGSAVDLVVFITRDGRRRRVDSVNEVIVDEHGAVRVAPLWTYDADTRQWNRVAEVSARLAARRRLDTVPVVTREHIDAFSQPTTTALERAA